MNERLARMRELGQAPWVDELSREDIENGGLQRMIDDGIVGVTSNPAIFQKAIGESDDYDEAVEDLARRGADVRALRLRARRAPGLIEDAKEVLLKLFDAAAEYSADTLEGIYDELEKSSKQVLSGEVTDTLAGGGW